LTLSHFHGHVDDAGVPVVHGEALALVAFFAILIGREVPSADRLSFSLVEIYEDEEAERNRRRGRNGLRPLPTPPEAS